MKYPIGIQSFEKIRLGEYTYVDKTALIHQLVNTSNYYFLSRPRRFGKSLLISTLEAYFNGQQELFKGLEIEQLEKEWTKYPVLHLDLNTSKYDEKNSLINVLNDTLCQWENIYGTVPSEVNPELRFKGIIRRAYEQTGQRVVILVDEYDKPMLQAIGDEELQNEYRNTLKAFYSVMKTQDRYIRFGFLTGVTKFGKVSVFSDLNNLIDLSMDRQFQTLCGMTDKEIHTYFEEPLHQIAENYGITYDEVCLRLKERYDGYRFRQNGTNLYNPFSLLNTFKYMRLSDYWFETGTPTYLVELLKRTNYDLYDMANTETDADVLNSIDSASNNPIPVIYQSGYLTIKDYEPEFKIYRLGFPNQEVEEGFMKYLLPFYTNIQASKSPFEIGRFVREVRAGDYDAFFHRLQGFFADTSYEAIIGRNPERDTELHYRNVLFIVFKLVGLYTQVEYHTSNGRIDLVLQTDRYVYIMEFKLNGTAEEALRQIEEKGYALPFAADKRQVIKIGANFSSETRNIERWLVG